MIRWFREHSQSLSFRLAALLALAILPIGLISVFQTYQLVREIDARDRASLMAMTVEAADREIAFIRNAMGVAQTVAAMLPMLRAQPETCVDALAPMVRADDPITFVGFVDATGTVRCASAAEGLNISDSPIFAQMQVADGPIVSASNYWRLPEQRLVVATPVLEAGDFAGYVAVAVRYDRTIDSDAAIEGRPVDVMTFNAEGDVLTSTHGMKDILMRLPAAHSLPALVASGETSFSAETAGGTRRLFSVAPIIEGQVYALGSWDDLNRLSERNNIATSLLFPLAMWVAGMGVAFFTVQTMVIRPTRNLRARMLVFMRTRKLIGQDSNRSVPRELAEMSETWERMAESILRDEEALHRSLQEKTVLLKEVHHRVKNNLQLIASMLNMKLRAAATESEKDILRDIQQHVMTIARVHQRLYETTEQERICAEELFPALLPQVVSNCCTGSHRVSLQQDYDPIVLYPDQAVPLSLALSEIVAQLLKKLTPLPEATALLRIELRQCADHMARLDLHCDFGSVEVLADGAPLLDTLSARLLQAFTMQLGGTLAQDSTPTECRITLEFALADFSAET